MRAVAIAIFVALLAVYVYSTAPQWGAMTLFNTWDGLEYVICANLLGIDHPPGHPLYLLTGKLFTLLPFGNPSWNINLLSAFFGAAAALFMFVIVSALLRPYVEKGVSVSLAAASSLTLAFSYVFWSHCGIPEVHTLQLAFTGAAIHALIKWQRSGKNTWLYAAALYLGVNIGVNILAVAALLAPVAILVIFSVRRGKKVAPAVVAGALALAGFGSYIYYPLRIAQGAPYSHPMNYLGPYPMGSAAWYFWYITGKAWTGGQMFFLSRIAGNIPLYMRLAARDLGPPLFILSIFGIILAIRQCVSLLRATARGDRASAREEAVVPFILLLFAFSLLPEISIHDPSNPRAYYYLQNFMLPSIYLLCILGAWGAMRLYLALRTRTSWGATLAVVILFSMPVYQCAANASSCVLRGQECAYTLSLRTLQQLPRGSVIVSKLVYGMAVDYFTKVERRIGPDAASILDPEVVAKNLAKGKASKDLFARRNSALLKDIKQLIEDGKEVFIAGDIVDEDKSPEKLLLSDLDLKRWAPSLTPTEALLTFPRELFLYRVGGLRRAAVVNFVPTDIRRAGASDGKFADGIELLGFRLETPDRRIRADLLSMEFFWKTTRRMEEEIYVGVIFMNAAMRHVGEPCWHTLGGTFGADQWKPGEIVRERVNVFPPPLPPGRYLLAIGMVDGKGAEIKYIPPDFATTGRTFAYVLLGSFDLGIAPYAGQ